MIVSLCTTNFIKVDAEVKSVYYTENGEREFSDSFNAVVQDRYYNSSLLTPGSNYVFNITAYTSDGPGPTVSESVTLDNGRKGKTIYVRTYNAWLLFCNKLVANCNLMNVV